MCYHKYSREEETGRVECVHTNGSGKVKAAHRQQQKGKWRPSQLGVAHLPGGKILSKSFVVSGDTVKGEKKARK